VDIERCPKCGRPRAVGHRCPSCGDAGNGASTAPGQREETKPGRADDSSWHGVPQPGGVSAGLGSLHPSLRPTRGKSRRGFLATAIVAGIVIAVVVVVVIMLTTGGAAVVKEQAAVVSTPDRAHDEAAQSLLRNAMTAIDATFVETGDYTTITQSALQTMEPAISWTPGRAGLYGSPPAKATTQNNAVAWTCTGRLSYELGTWSASGVSFGVRVDKAGGGVSYFTNGTAASW
jgi:hypothetical protein